MAKNKKKLVMYLFIAILMLGLVYIFFNERGVFKYYSIQSQVDSMQVELDKIRIENEQLKNEIDSLQKKIPAKMEQVAREKYNMKREGETLIEIEEK